MGYWGGWTRNTLCTCLGGLRDVRPDPGPANTVSWEVVNREEGLIDIPNGLFQPRGLPAYTADAISTFSENCPATIHVTTVRFR